MNLHRLKKTARHLLIAIPLLGLLLTACVAPSQGSAAISVGEGIIYAASPQGKVLALDPEQRRRGLPFPGDGEWVSPAEKGFGTIYAQPLPSGDDLFVATFDGKVRVLNRASGASRGESPLFPAEKQPKGQSLVATPALAGNTLLLATGNRLLAIDVQSGRLRWARPFKAQNRIWASPVVLGDRVVFGSLDRRLYAVRLATGEEVWRFETGGGVAATPLVVDSTIYFGSFDGNLYAIGSDGRPRWASPFRVSRWVWNRPLYHGDTVYFGGLNGVFYAVGAATGKERWKQDTGDSLRASPVVADGVLVVATARGTVYGLDPASGAQQWKHPLEAGVTISADLGAYQGEVFIPSEQGTVYALEARTGKLAWSFPLKR